MLTLPPSVRIFIAGEPIDGRKGLDALVSLVSGSLTQDPLSGHLFVFLNRRGDIVRALFWDRTGYCLLSKRLERGRFQLPWNAPTGTSHFEIEATDLMLLLEGIDLRGSMRRTRWSPVSVTTKSTEQRQSSFPT